MLHPKRAQTRGGTMEAMAGLETSIEAADTGSTDLSSSVTDPEIRYLNRELSWLDFNARVLALAEDPSLPLLERVKFIAIFSQNLDEFFQVRVAALSRQVDAGLRTASPDGRDPQEQLRAIRDEAEELVNRMATVFSKDVTPALEEAGIRFVHWDDLTDDDRAHLDSVFEERVFPVLTPLAVDPPPPQPQKKHQKQKQTVKLGDTRSGSSRSSR
jgi:polyphosphate kinase